MQIIAMVAYFVEGCFEIYVARCDREPQRYFANDSTFWCSSANMIGNVLYLVSVVQILQYLHTMDAKCSMDITISRACYVGVRSFESGPKWRDIKIICVVADQIYLVACFFPIYDLIQDWREHQNQAMSSSVLPLDVASPGGDHTGTSQAYALLINGEDRHDGGRGSNAMLPATGQLYVHRPPSLSFVGRTNSNADGNGGASGGGPSGGIGATGPAVNNTNSSSAAGGDGGSGGGSTQKKMNNSDTIVMSFADLTAAASSANDTMPRVSSGTYEPPPVSPGHTTRSDSL